MSSAQDEGIAKLSPAKDGPAKSRTGPYARNRAVYSAIDLGTNNCRLLIARPTYAGFRVVDAFSRIVRLGEGLGATGRLSDEAMDRAIAALKICAQKIRHKQVTCMRSVATEACRTAKNCDQFVARVKAETGLNLDVISPAEEARLAVVGCQSLLDPAYGHALVFDIGGGSTELILVERRPKNRLHILAWTSMPYGVVNLSERFDCQSLDRARYAEMVGLIRAHLDRFEALASLRALQKNGAMQLLGTSGTITTLASVQMGLPRYDRNKVDGAWLEQASIHDLARNIALMPYEARLAEPCIGEDRVDYVVAGCAILDALLAQWSFKRLRVADRGIREGVLRGLMGAGAVIGPGRTI
ncbi:MULTISPECIES: Ppx/GppA phosphatase family protein [unclassified Iodidimonas]|jgi:exopolyphosphatase/guanosine-5'-triphosphate,3'-diphosphate pyrophosphatase|uniref:Ppx/GppA phosphatase family protein n=1 Tax=unclassified Iodidimonas TaxID=2626145 RepID=UPI002483290D|nr:MULTISPECIES: Ppx/GppA phosphatase family protein [unclassified Iodidimonas]